jgi:mono/diheme cytochrome c family protein
MPRLMRAGDGLVAAIGLTGLLVIAGPARAQEIFSGKFGQQTGEDLYHGICQGCHMPNGAGATGAGTYPSLVHNPKLAAAVYPITVVVNGQRAMPSFGGLHESFPAYLTDSQIANVLNYVRTHFGNHYTDVITTEQVKALHRPAEASAAEASAPAATPGNNNAVSH